MITGQLAVTTAAQTFLPSSGPTGGSITIVNTGSAVSFVGIHGGATDSTGIACPVNVPVVLVVEPNVALDVIAAATGNTLTWSFAVGVNPEN